MSNDKLNIFEFKELLQKEFIQFTLCEKMFAVKFKEKYAEKLIEHKAKILHISERLGVENIFTDTTLMESVINDFIPEYGSPKFVYRNESGREKMECVMNNYLFKGVKGVMVKDKGLVEIIQNNPTEGTLTSIEDEDFLYEDVQCPFSVGEVVELVQIKLANI